MGNQSLKEKAVNGVIWSGLEKTFSRLLTLIFSILIARQLVPEDYGIVAMLNIFLAISQTFIDSGFAAACVRKLDRTDDDFNTMFLFNVAVAIIIYVILWFSAPLIAQFYDTPILKQICRVSSLSLVIGALRGVHSIKLSIDVNFKSFAITSIISATISGIFGLIMAYHGYGVWTLVYQQILNAILWTILLWIIVRWRPSLVFSKQSFKNLFSFGSRLLGSGLLNALYNNIYPLVIGKAFAPKELGVYTKAGGFSDFASLNVSSVIMPVFYPVFSNLQNEKDRLIFYYKKSISILSYIVFPLCFGLASVSGPFVRSILTEQWYGMVPILMILCFSTILQPIHDMNLNMLKVIGRSDVLLNVEAIIKALGILILIVSIPFGILGVCFGRVIAGILTYIIDSFVVKKIFKLDVFEQIYCLRHGIILSVIMSGAVLCIVQMIPTDIAKLLCGILCGTAIYTITSLLSHAEEFGELKTICLSKIKK